MEKNKKTKKGSTTLEAAIIMPTILIIIFAVFFAFQVLYEHVILEYAVSYGATRGAMMWDYVAEGVDFVNGTGNEKVGIYYNLDQMLNNEGVSEREGMIEDQTRKIIDKLTIMSGGIDVDAHFDGKIIGRTVTVYASHNVAIPFQGFFEYFGGSKMLLEASSSAGLYDPDEYIRNIDYIYELAHDIADQVADKFGEINSRRKKK